MLRYIALIIILFALPCIAQINISPYLPEYLEVCYPVATSALNSKLSNILSANDIKQQMGPSRFVLTGNIVPITKDVVSSAPPQIAYTLNVNLHIGDGETGTKYISETFQVKGVGVTEEKAYLAAIKNLQAKTTRMSHFVKNGKERIIEFYEDNKNHFFAQVNNAITNGNYDEAIYILCSLPMECSYNAEIEQKINQVYQDMIDSNCIPIFNEAKATWAANQNEEGANKVIALISQIDPKVSFFQEVQDFINIVNTKINLINERAYATYQKNLEHRHEMDKLELEASREKNRLDAEVTQTRIKANADVEKTKLQTNAKKYAEQQATQRERNRQTAALASQAMSASEKLQSQRISAARDVAITYAKNRPKSITYNVNNW